MDFETAAVRTKEDRIQLFRRECMLASVAVANNAAGWLAHLWGSDVSTQQINRRALVWNTFPLENILPDISLALYGAALDAARKEDGTEGGTLSSAHAVAWLGAAIRKRWSPRELRDAADVLKGKHFSSTAFRGRVTITEWDISTGHVAAKGLQISGNMPVVAEMMVREVLEK